MAISTEDILSAFDTMTILELSEFSKAFQDRYGVTASAPMGMMATMPAQGGGSAAVEEAPPEPTEFNVILTGISPTANKINVIKIVRQLNSALGLKEAKEAVDTAPTPIKEAVSKEDADAAKATLEEAGATVEVQGVV